MTDSELVAYLREHLMLEAEPKGSGTEGRTPAQLWFLPFGHRVDPGFKQIIKLGISRLGQNSYYDGPLTLFETLLGKCEGTTPEDERAFAVVKSDI